MRELDGLRLAGGICFGLSFTYISFILCCTVPSVLYNPLHCHANGLSFVNRLATVPVVFATCESIATGLVDANVIPSIPSHPTRT